MTVPDETPATTDAAEAGPAASAGDAWARLGRLFSPRAVGPRGIVVALLCAVLGFALVAAVRGNTTDSFLATARQSDLVRVLDDLGQRQARLETELRSLQASRDRILSGSQAQALAETTQRADAYAILAGTVAATGPGIEITITDSSGGVDSATRLDAVQELRDAGAEAIQIGAVRVIASTWFADGDRGGISVSGTVVTSPYRIRVIGDSATLATALGIPGGVSDSVRAAGGRIAIVEKARVDVTALHPLSTPQYAQPAPSPSG